jgi:hypothetical protein
MFRSITAATLLMLTIPALPALAADESPAAAPAITVSAGVSRSLSRPKALPALYASYAVLQAYDVYSTKQGLARGGREANPLMQGAVGNTGTFIAMKAAVGVGTIMAAEQLWKKKNKMAAIAVMVAGNGVAAIVAARNARTLTALSK